MNIAADKGEVVVGVADAGRRRGKAAARTRPFGVFDGLVEGKT